MNKINAETLVGEFYGQNKVELRYKKVKMKVGKAIFFATLTVVTGGVAAPMVGAMAAQDQERLEKRGESNFREARMQKLTHYANAILTVLPMSEDRVQVLIEMEGDDYCSPVSGRFLAERIADKAYQVVIPKDNPDEVFPVVGTLLETDDKVKFHISKAFWFYSQSREGYKCTWKVPVNSIFNYYFSPEEIPSSSQHTKRH